MDDNGFTLPVDFKSLISNLTIRTKLISIISLILILALSGMILLATRLFKSDNEIRANELNHKIAEITSLNIQTDFAALVEKLNLMGNTIIQNFPQKGLFTDLFFANDRNMLYVGICRPAGNAYRTDDFIFSKTAFAENRFSLADMPRINAGSAEAFGRAFGGEAYVQNVSKSFGVPAVVMALPFQKNADGSVASVVFGYLKLDKFLQAFQTKDIFETFMVNSGGDIIAHPDSKIVLSHGNFINLPIVEEMLKSKLDNGQKRFRDADGAYLLGSFKKIGIGGLGVISTVSEEKAFKAVYQIQRRNLLIMIIVLTLAVLIVYFFSKTITTPIIRLFSATKEIEKGNFRVDIASTSGDEIGELTRSFVSMGRGLEEREKLKETFGKFVNKEIAELVLKGEIKLGGERKTATVFFSDIRDFTAISEKLEPEEVVEFLNEYMTRMVGCVNATNGVVDKYIGDAIMAVWGAPVSYGNDTENAIDGALMMRKRADRVQPGARGREEADHPDRLRHQYRPGAGRPDRVGRADGIHGHRRHRQPRVADRAAEQALRDRHPDLPGHPHDRQGNLSRRADAEDQGKGQGRAPADLRRPGTDGRPLFAAEPGRYAPPSRHRHEPESRKSPTRPRKSMRSSNNINPDHLAVGISALIITVCSVLLYADYSIREGAGDAKRIGTITYKKKVAQRKFASQVVWEDLEQNTPVYNNDTIRTADLSEAIVNLEDGTSINLDENSLILLATTGAGINIDFSHGSITANRAAGATGDAGQVTIQSKEAVVSLDKGDVKLSKTGDRGMDVTVTAGTAEIKTGSVEKTIAKDEKAVITGDRQAKVVKLNLKLSSPRPNENFVTAAAAMPVSFAWSRSEGVGAVNLEIARDGGFARGVLTRPSAGTAHVENLAEGTYYWRIRALNAGTGAPEYSDIRRLGVIRDLPLRLLYPRTNEVISYSVKPPIINLRWAENKLAAEYIVEISRDPAFQKHRPLRCHAVQGDFRGSPRLRRLLLARKNAECRRRCVRRNERRLRLQN